ncbi:dynein light chain [Trypanosoma conorhini]|uniref:Dynein light chain n=1 Tax=Trypanosoma conorhini TaxID=83891 RepID=A0A3R7NZ62_9TRYP|nr:dynein light chain [Trypanosoma conorhini]RNF26143.1 dynein light chain [Trypanosoma conorhini]
MSVEASSDALPATDAAADASTTAQNHEPEVPAGANTEEAVATEKATTVTTGTPAVFPASAPYDEIDSGEPEEAEKATEHEDSMEISGIPPNDVKNIILQVLSPYFDDEGGEDDAQRYDHVKAQGWIQLICDGIMEKLLGMRRPYKYVVHCMIMRKCGAGIHVCSSCYYSQADGWVNHAHDLSAHIYAVVTVYWSVI